MSEPRLGASYVLPLRWFDDDDLDELTAYLREIAPLVEVVVVDGSPPDLFARHAAAWPGLARHVPPEVRTAMGKVGGVITGVRLASHDAVVIADDDVRYDAAGLARMVELLGRAELVRPQNYFAPAPWHARWDTGRTLLNRAVGADYPGTLGVRRSLFVAMGGYDGDVMFENLELMRTVEAAGGRTLTPLDLFVRRLPPTSEHFLKQRVRQAYDDFALPARMALFLAIVPAVLATRQGRRATTLVGFAAVSVLVAEAGRRRGGGRAVFPATAPLWAPAWVAERAVCSWLAVASRLRHGGVPYGGGVIPRAATSRRELRRRFAARRVEPQSARA